MARKRTETKYSLYEISGKQAMISSSTRMGVVLVSIQIVLAIVGMFNFSIGLVSIGVFIGVIVVVIHNLRANSLVEKEFKEIALKVK